MTVADLIRELHYYDGASPIVFIVRDYCCGWPDWEDGYVRAELTGDDEPTGRVQIELLEGP